MALAFRGKIAAAYEPWFLTPRGRFADKLEKEIIQKLISLKPRARVLDVGCGTGHFSVFFRQKFGVVVTGIDPSPAMLEQAGNLYGNREIDFRLGSAYALPFSDHSFDLVTMITVLELLEDPVRALREAFRVSRGKIFLGILNRSSLLAWQRKKAGKPIWRQVHFYTLPEIKNLLGVDKKIKWETALYLPLLKTKRGFAFRLSLERGLSRFKLPGGAFIGILAEQKRKEN